MIYEEFLKYNLVLDKNNPFCNHYVLDSGEEFYVEPAFYTQMIGLFERYPEQKENFMSGLEKIVINNKCVAFVYDFENPFLDYGDAVLREFVDVTDSCKIFYEDKSRGSDYGD